MQVQVQVDEDFLQRNEMTVAQVESAVAIALGCLDHPETGEVIYQNGVSVTASVELPALKAA